MKKLRYQVNIRLTEDEVKAIDDLNKSVFGGEANYAMLCRFLIKEGMKNMKDGK